MMPDKEFWEERWKTGQTGWDLGEVSKPLKNYIDQLENKELKILIPGAGNSYEAEYLFKNGFKNVFVVDISKSAIDSFLERVPEFPVEQAIYNDFFQLKSEFDLILEQTFFCALDPKLRENYIKKVNELLRTNGKLVGLLFSVPLFANHPPYGGNEKEYEELFELYFTFNTFESSYNSSIGREGQELFINFKKKE